jgi:hypothetical protein
VVSLLVKQNLNSSCGVPFAHTMNIGFVTQPCWEREQTNKIIWGLWGKLSIYGKKKQIKGTKKNYFSLFFFSKKSRKSYAMSLLVPKNYIVHAGSLSWLFSKFHQEVYWLRPPIFINNKWQLSLMGNRFFVGILPNFGNLHEHTI